MDEISTALHFRCQILTQLDNMSRAFQTKHSRWWRVRASNKSSKTFSCFNFISLHRKPKLISHLMHDSLWGWGDNIQSFNFNASNRELKSTERRHKFIRIFCYHLIHKTTTSFNGLLWQIDKRLARQKDSRLIINCAKWFNDLIFPLLWRAKSVSLSFFFSFSSM